VIAALTPHLNEALWQDLERRLGTADLIGWLERESERVAQLGRRESGHIDVSSAELLRDRRVGKLRAVPYMPALATIQARDGSYEIRYVPYQRREDTRFGIAHELAHTFWFSPTQPGEPLSPLQRALGDDPTIEWLCNRGGAAILLPRGDVMSFIGEGPRGLHRIPELAKRYVVPERLVARRLFQEFSDVEVTIAGISLKGEASSRTGTVAWLVPFQRSGRRRKSATGRVVPADMIPQVPLGPTHELAVDGRWLLLEEGTATAGKARPLNSYAAQAGARAWVCRTVDTVYLAIPKQG